MLKEFKKAFTLAEVLIVIGIIGVVAALTLPNLNHATGDKETVTRVKKIYSTLSEAVDRAQAIYGPFDTWTKGLSSQGEKAEQFAKRVTEFMKVSKDCGFDDGCFSSAPLISSDGDIYFENYLEDLQAQPTYMALLSDGMSLGYQYGYMSDDPRIRVDIDGPNKGKNMIGYDIFDFQIPLSGVNANQLLPSMELSGHGGIPGKYSEAETGGYKNNYATAWVIENGNLDYLKCYDELNWETKTSCE